ncbi:aspartate aminotransferase [compost metagenome]
MSLWLLFAGWAVGLVGGLGLAPGSAFGPEGEGYVRWCFAASEAKLADGVARLKSFL